MTSPAPAALPSTAPIWIGIGLSAVYVALLWWAAPEIAGDAAGVIRIPLLLSLLVQVAGGVMVATGKPASGALWVAWGSALLLVPSLVALYGARRLRNEAVRHEIVAANGGGAPNAQFTMDAFVDQQQYLGAGMAVVGLIMSVIGIGPGGILLASGAVMFVGGRYLEKHPQLELYDTFLLWTPAFLRVPTAVPYAGLRVEQTPKAVTLTGGAKPVVIQKAMANERTRARIADAVGLATSGGVSPRPAPRP